jgi:hypothetical protein
MPQFTGGTGQQQL